jgi:hypothetical protein
VKQKMQARAQTTRKSDVTNGLESASPSTFLEKPVELFNPTPATQPQSNVQTQKSREFPGCRIIHTFFQRITPPDVLAAGRSASGQRRIKAWTFPGT